ncbi:unnamed protein product [Moneuplotes crassus]|uniref:Uncharacterized protein n=1 Tax=Euplotes crassus TaxID=5936 RepID=A0AAD1U5F1_EUPCR|nr:unnamed protein product [Moneuplotes crassus]
MAKVLQNNTLMLVLSCESFKDQIVVVQFRGTSHSELVVSKLKKVDINISKVKALSVFSNFKSKTENMLYCILINNKGQIMTLKITAHTFRTHLPGYELMSREQTEPIRSEIVRARDHHWFTDYVSVINHYKGKTELVMMQIHNSSQFYSHTFHKEISEFSAYCYTQQYMMAFVQFSDGSSLKLHAKMKQDTDFEIRQDPVIDPIIERSTSACLYNGFLVFANYSTSDLLKIHKATFANCQLNFTM